MVGVLNGEAELDGVPFPFHGGDQPAFLVILDAQGNHVFSETYSAPRGSTINDDVAAAPGGGVYVTGTHYGEVDFGGGSLPQPGMAGADERMHLVRFGANGAHQWSVGLGVPGRALSPFSITVGADGNPVVAAQYDRGDLDLGQGPITGDLVGGTAFLTFSAADGSLLNIRPFPNVTTCRFCFGGANGTLYLTGGLRAPVDFGDGAIPGAFDPSGVVGAGFLAALGADGTHQASLAWAGSLQQQPQFQLHQIGGIDLAPDGRGGLWWIAQYEGRVDLAPGVPLSDATMLRNVALVHFAP
jgi:hypothetical protein